MNKNTVDQEINIAYEALAEVGIAQNGKIEKTYRGQISSFGAAVTMGSLLSAIAFFSQDGGSDVSRSKLMDAILIVLKKRGIAKESFQKLFDYAKSSGEEGCKEDIINAAIALKLSMNLYELVKKSGD